MSNRPLIGAEEAAGILRVPLADFMVLAKRCQYRKATGPGGESLFDADELRQESCALDDEEAWRNLPTLSLKLAPHVRAAAQKTRALIAADSIPEVGGVYFIGPEQPRVIKIGVARDSLRKRLVSMQAQWPERVHLLAWRPVRVFQARHAEHEEHVRWAHLREHGEWFTFSPELREYVEALRRAEP